LGIGAIVIDRQNTLSFEQSHPIRYQTFCERHLKRPVEFDQTRHDQLSI
jgi:hypothetical protein